MFGYVLFLFFQFQKTEKPQNFHKKKFVSLINGLTLHFLFLFFNKHYVLVAKLLFSLILIAYARLQYDE